MSIFKTFTQAQMDGQRVKIYKVTAVETFKELNTDKLMLFLELFIYKHT